MANLLKEGALEPRAYQEAIFARAVEKNLLVVLPTGLGKTPIAVMLAAHRLQKFPGSRVMVLAPTRPLSDQHRSTFLSFMSLEPARMATITGSISPAKRPAVYKEASILFATPQTIENDVNSGTLSLTEFSLLVIDEIHRGVGKYPYPFLAARYMEQAENPRILGLTASPASDYDKIKEICSHAHIEDVEIRAEADSDVSPYVRQKSVDWEEVSLPESFLEIRRRLAEAYGEKISGLGKMGFRVSRRMPKKEMLALQKRVAMGLRSDRQRGLIALSMINQAMRIDHALMLLETQGIISLENYFAKLRADEKQKRIFGNRHVSQAAFLANSLFSSGATHPKMARLCSIVSAELQKNSGSKMIVFASYRDMVSQIVGSLSKISLARPVAFIGQKAGLSQKRQVSILQEFREGKYNILVGTSISEEGLDIPSMDTAIFYEPVPSEIRSIQRRGRVGRHAAGRVMILIAKGTRDEAYYWSAKRKEKRMRGILRGMQGMSLGDFA